MTQEISAEKALWKAETLAQHLEFIEWALGKLSEKAGETDRYYPLVQLYELMIDAHGESCELRGILKDLVPAPPIDGAATARDIAANLRGVCSEQ